MEHRQRIAQMERARFITRNFRAFQGYRMLPWVPALLLWGGSEARLLRGDWWLWAFAVSIGLAVVGWLLVDRWYRRTYGSVQPTWDRRQPSVTAVTVLGLVGLAVIGFWVGVTGRSVTLAVSWEGALIGAVFAEFGWRIRKVAPVVLWSGIWAVVLSALPLGMLEELGGVHPFSSGGGLFVLLAALVTVAGVSSHAALARMLGSGRRRSTAS